jgi:hypothetical protein
MQKRSVPMKLWQKLLSKPLIGADAVVTDGSQCYNAIRDYNCLFHKKMEEFLRGGSFPCGTEGIDDHQ